MARTAQRAKARIRSALQAGADGLKLFPGSLHGPDGLKAIRAVLPKGTQVYAVGGASPAMALQCAAAAVATGACNHVLITFGRNVSAAANKAGARIHSMPQFHYVTEFEHPMGARTHLR